MGIGNNISFVIATPSEVFKGERDPCGSEKKLSNPRESYCINTTESVSTQSVLQDAYSLFYKIKTLRNYSVVVCIPCFCEALSLILSTQTNMPFSL